MCVTKLYVTKLWVCDKVVCDNVFVTRRRRRRGGGGGGGPRGGADLKTRIPHNFVGKKSLIRKTIQY